MSRFDIRIENDHSSELLRRLRDRYQTALMAGGRALGGYAKELAPVDTGNLRNSIDTQMSAENEVQVGSNVEYAKYQELGTSRNRPQPYLRPAAEANEQTIVEIVASVLRNV